LMILMLALSNNVLNLLFLHKQAKSTSGTSYG